MTPERKLAGVIVYVLKISPAPTRVLFLKRSGGQHEGSWWPVAGTPEGNESGKETALRELAEETSLVPSTLLDFGIEIPHVDAQSRLETFVAIVDPESEVKLNYEHSEFQWLTGDQAVSMVPPHSRGYLAHLRDHFMGPEGWRSDDLA